MFRVETTVRGALQALQLEPDYTTAYAEAYTKAKKVAHQVAGSVHVWGNGADQPDCPCGAGFQVWVSSRQPAAEAAVFAEVRILRHVITA
jgi:hypothetical protein